MHASLATLYIISSLNPNYHILNYFPKHLISCNTLKCDDIEMSILYLVIVTSLLSTCLFKNKRF